MSRITRLLLLLTLLTFASFARATPPPAADFGLGTAAAASGQTVPVANGKGGSVGNVPEPETWLFTLTGLLAAGLLRRRKR